MDSTQLVASWTGWSVWRTREIEGGWCYIGGYLLNSDTRGYRNVELLNSVPSQWGMQPCLTEDGLLWEVSVAEER